MPSASDKQRRILQTSAARAAKRQRVSGRVDGESCASTAVPPDESDEQSPDSYRSIGFDLFLVSDPAVIVCKLHKHVVFNPVSHLAKLHNVKVSKNQFENLSFVSSLVPLPFDKINTLPFIDIVAGVMCSMCGVAACHKHNLPCDCGPEFSQITDVQRFGGRGAAKHTFAIKGKETVPVPDDSEELDVDKIVKAALAQATCSPAQSERELNKFYLDLNWFVSDGEIEEFRSSRLNEYFLCPPEVGPEWEYEIKRIFIHAFDFVNGAPLLIRSSMGYKIIRRASEEAYIPSFVKILSFLINMSLRPSSAFPQFSLRSSSLVPALIQTHSDGSVFRLLEIILAQAPGSRGFVVDTRGRSKPKNESAMYLNERAST